LSKIPLYKRVGKKKKSKLPTKRRVTGKKNFVGAKKKLVGDTRPSKRKQNSKSAAAPKVEGEMSTSMVEKTFYPVKSLEQKPKKEHFWKKARNEAKKIGNITLKAIDESAKIAGKVSAILEPVADIAATFDPELRPLSIGIHGMDATSRMIDHTISGLERGTHSEVTRPGKRIKLLTGAPSPMPLRIMPDVEEVN
jgi:hypothetical protein